jgi:hypothetical protein
MEHRQPRDLSRRRRSRPSVVHDVDIVEISEHIWQGHGVQPGHVVIRGAPDDVLAAIDSASSWRGGPR